VACGRARIADIVRAGTHRRVDRAAATVWGAIASIGGRLWPRRPHAA
jgi:hypothetical protein